MRKLVLIIFSFFTLLYSCNDGEAIDINLDFDQELELCTSFASNGSNNFILFDILDDPGQSLTVIFPATVENNLILRPTEAVEDPLTLNINGSSVRFNYRTYTGNPNEVICQGIPSSSVAIIDDFEATSGTIEYTSTVTDDTMTNMRTVAVTFTIINFDIDILRSDFLTLGTYTETFPIP